MKDSCISAVPTRLSQSQVSVRTDLDFLHGHEGCGLEVAAEELRPGLGLEFRHQLKVEALDGAQPRQAPFEGLVAVSADQERGFGGLLGVVERQGGHFVSVEGPVDVVHRVRPCLAGVGSPALAIRP